MIVAVIPVVAGLARARVVVHEVRARAVNARVWTIDVDITQTFTQHVNGVYQTPPKPWDKEHCLKYFSRFIKITKLCIQLVCMMAKFNVNRPLPYENTCNISFLLKNVETKQIYKIDHV